MRKEDEKRKQMTLIAVGIAEQWTETFEMVNFERTETDTIEH